MTKAKVFLKEQKTLVMRVHQHLYPGISDRKQSD